MGQLITPRRLSLPRRLHLDGLFDTPVSMNIGVCARSSWTKVIFQLIKKQGGHRYLLIISTPATISDNTFQENTIRSSLDHILGMIQVIRTDNSPFRSQVPASPSLTNIASAIVRHGQYPIYRSHQRSSQHSWEEAFDALRARKPIVSHELAGPFCSGEVPHR